MGLSEKVVDKKKELKCAECSKPITEVGSARQNRTGLCYHITCIDKLFREGKQAHSWLWPSMWGDD